MLCLQFKSYDTNAFFSGVSAYISTCIPVIIYISIRLQFVDGLIHDLFVVIQILKLLPDIVFTLVRKFYGVHSLVHGTFEQIVPSEFLKFTPFYLTVTGKM